MSRGLRWLGIVAAAAVWAGPLGAQDGLSDDDIFAEGAFDDAVAQGQSSEEANKLVWLGGVSLVPSASLVVPTSGAVYGSQGQFAGKGFVKATQPAFGSLFVAYTYSYSQWLSTNDPALAAGYAQLKADPAGPTYKLSEAHLSFDFGKTVFVRVGSQLVDWGASAIWSPADFLNRKTTDPLATLDTRAGKPGVRVHVPFAGGNAFVFADASRSLTASGGARDLVETGSLGFRVDGTLVGWNLGLVGNFGKTSDPRAGLTAVGALFGVDLWAEAAAVLPLQDRTFSWSASLGGEKSFGQDSEWTVRSEGFWNPDGRADTVLTDAVVRSSFTPFYWGQVYAYGELAKKKLIGTDVDGSASVTANLSDASWTAKASLATSFPQVIPFTVFVQYAGGEKNREFTLGTGGPAWTLGVRSLLEF